jgi:hypothetical protein
MDDPVVAVPALARQGWAELRDPSSMPTLHQTGTYAPADGLSRWMGSVNVDARGNMAVGYSVASSTTFPGLRYAARLASDPLGELGQGEAVIIDGSSSTRSRISPGSCARCH